MPRTATAVTVLLLAALAGPAYADGTEKEADAAIATFKKAYAAHEESARVSAVEALGAVQHKQVVEALAGPLAKDPSSDVRRAAAAALAGQWSPRAVSVLAKALDPERSPHEVTLAIIEALGKTESDEAVPALVALLGVNNKFATDNTGATFTAAALDALGRLGSARATEDVISFLSQEGLVSRQAEARRLGADGLLRSAAAALGAITGEKLTSPEQWRRWWAQNKDSLRTIAVFRCTETGRTFDRLDARTKCPADGDKHPDCGRFLKTRYEGGGLGIPEKPKPAKPAKPAKTALALRAPSA